MEMLPVMCLRQVRNSLLRRIGIRIRTTYHTRIGPQDVLRITEVQQEPFRREIYKAVVSDIDDHGWYSVVKIHRLDNGSDRAVTIYRDGPPDWGVIECRVIKRIWIPLEPSDAKRI